MRWTSKRPDMHTSRLQWERSWERDFQNNFPRGAVAPKNTSFIPASVFAASNTDRFLIEVEREEALICQLQHDIGTQAVRRFAEDRFEDEWKALSDEKRREIILEGIYRTMRIPDMEERRKWCPDSSLEHLASRGGNEYLRMLKCVIPQSIDAPPLKPLEIAHKFIDDLFTPTEADRTLPGAKTAYRNLKNSRTYVLSVIIWNIFLAFYGLEELQQPVRPSRGTAIPPDALPKSVAREIVREHNEQRKGIPNACSYCGIAETMLQPGQKLQACSRCKPLGRRVFYCSKNCQVNDWKSGLPRPHKLVCGKAFTEDTIPEKTAPAPIESAAGIPPADPGFKRSPALLHQIKLLNDSPQVDYVLVHPYPEPDQGLVLANVMGQIMFTLMRNRAFKSGDPRAVQMMFKFLRPIAEQNGVSETALRRQLASEFPGVPLDMAGGPEPSESDEDLISEEEVRQAIGGLGI